MTKQAEPPPPGDKPTPTAPPPAWRHWLWPLAVLLAVGLWAVLPGTRSSEPVKTDLTYSKFLDQVDDGKVKSVTIKAGGEPNGTLSNGHRFTTAVPVQMAGDRLEEKKVAVTATPPSTSPSAGSRILSWILLLGPFLLIIWFWRRMPKGAAGHMQGMLGGVGKSKVFDAERPETTFADVAGYEGAKAEIAEVVDFLRRPERYRRGDIDLDVVARGTPGFSGVDLANLANEASIVAVRDGREALTADDFDSARDRILLGRREGSNVLPPRRRRSPSMRQGMPWSPRCPRAPIRSPRSPFCLPGRPSASPSNCPSSNATCTARTTSRRPSRYGSAVAPPNSSCSGRAPPEPPTTWPAPPNWPPRWSANSASPPRSVRWATRRAARSSWAAAGAP